jgi:beta-lactamase superfamily II metal-dependent hydrolase
MPAEHVLNVDLAKVLKREGDRNKFLAMLAWGDAVTVTRMDAKRLEVEIAVGRLLPDGSLVTQMEAGFIEPKAPFKPADLVVKRTQNEVLRVDFVDVQQGDGSVIETPRGKVVLLDGGDNQLFARYLASRFRRTSESKPREIDCIVVSHGDADHFLGLVEIQRSETLQRLKKEKRLFIHPQRVYHNGLVKRPGKTPAGRTRKDVEMLGATRKVKDPATGKSITLVTGLEKDLLSVDPAEMNEPFRDWQDALRAYRKRGPIEFRRLQKGDATAFDFLKDEGVDVEVLGPIPIRVGSVEGLRFLGEPPSGPRVGQESVSLDEKGFSGFSASHTINGHSVIFRLTYGRFSLLFTGDLNDEAGRVLASAHSRGELNLQSDVFKVPHHGSADFSGAFIQAVAPVVSVVSSGDEQARKEYIHPRATIMGALGRYGRVAEPLVFVTELAAFFSIEGFVDPRYHELTADGRAAIKDKEQVVDPKRKRFFALSRTAFGIVMVRTDGKRLLVYTNSGKVDMKEAYAFEIDEWGKPQPSPVRKV